MQVYLFGNFGQFLWKIWISISEFIPFRWSTLANLKQKKAMQSCFSCGWLLWEEGGRLLWEERQSWSSFDPLSLKMKRKNNQMCAENLTANKLLDDIWAVWFFFWLCDACLFSWLFPKPEKGLLAKMSQCILFSIFSLCSKGRLTLHPALVHHYENNNSKAQRKVGRKGTVWSWLKLSDFCFAEGAGFGWGRSGGD